MTSHYEIRVHAGSRSCSGEAEVAVDSVRTRGGHLVRQYVVTTKRSYVKFNARFAGAIARKLSTTGPVACIRAGDYEVHISNPKRVALEIQNAEVPR